MILTSFFNDLKRYFKDDKTFQFIGTNQSFNEFFVSMLKIVLRNKKLSNQYDLSSYKNIVVVVPTYKEFSSWIDILSDETSKCYPLSFWGLWGSDRFIDNFYLKLQRLRLFSRLCIQELETNEEKNSKNEGNKKEIKDDIDINVVVTTLQGLNQKTISKKEFKKGCFKISKDDSWDLDELIFKLEESGYKKDSSVQEETFFAVRGGIIDIYSPAYEYPCRIEFWGDKVVSLRLFDPSSQSSFKEVSSFWVSFCREVILKQDEESKRKNIQFLHEYLSSLENVSKSDRENIIQEFDLDHRGSNLEVIYPMFRSSSDSDTGFSYFKEDSIFVFPRSYSFCEEEFENFIDDIDFLYKKDSKEGRICIDPSLVFEKKLEDFNRKNTIELSNPIISSNSNYINITVPNISDIKVSTKIDLNSSNLNNQKEEVTKTSVFDNWMNVIKEFLKENKVIILFNSEETETRIKNILEYKNIGFKNIKDYVLDVSQSKIQNSILYISKGYLSNYLILNEDTLIIPDHVLFGRIKTKKSSSKKLQNYLSSFKELSPGKLVVHIEHGIGKYCGIVSLNIGGVQSDFLQLEYADKDKILLPVYRLDFLQKYNGNSDNVSLDKLKSKGWINRKNKVRKEIKDIAEELLRVQAERKLSKGVSISPVSEDYYKFEQNFMFEETEDQLKAIEDVNLDLSSTTPMDRLICGDVGFGKTEVAIRAVYRTCMDGYQALILVPTTVLCYQHYRTFSDRLSGYGIRVAQVNRFVGSREIKKNIEDTENGNIDVLIGTHRLLSKDIKVKKLGLLVVDEEQKFGVMHKEKIKKFQYGCNVLTLSATPIPRTLHMAMLGMKDISLISTPPVNRLGIKTYVTGLDPILIKEAIRKEVLRGGQVFFVHNRVEDIGNIYSYLKELVPDVSMKVAHGRMQEDELEKVIIEFLDNKFSVLICTTIIESGVDMPNVNTIIVHNADKFGLSQLYQLRGRVGRSFRQAYAYFLTSSKNMSEEALQRLSILSSYQDLGAGFEIASHDLELRGAGDLIGARQSGNVNSVGFELYTQMLDEVIRELRGEKVEERVDVEIKIPVSVSIPRNYIKEENFRLNLYKQIFSSNSNEEISKVLKDTLDRFGMFPVEVFLLFKIAYLKRALIQCGGRSIAKVSEGKYEIKFGSLSEKQIDAILKLISVDSERCSITPDYKLIVSTKYKDGNKKGINKDRDRDISQDEDSLENRFKDNRDVVEINKLLGVIESLVYSLE